MSVWLDSSGNSNKFKQSYFRDFVDVSGEVLIRNGLSLKLYNSNVPTRVQFSINSNEFRIYNDTDHTYYDISNTKLLHLQDLSENVQAKLNQVNAVQSALNSKASTSSVDASFASVTRSIADKATTTIVDASFASVTSAVATKASTTIVDASFASVTSAIALKASTTIVDASFASVTSAIANKATTTIVDASFASVTSAIALKATKSIVDASFASVNSAIDLKATKSIVDASFTSVNSSIDLKATQSIVDASFTSVNSAVALKANLASPALTGVPTAPTATAGTNTTQLATTAFVKSAVDNLVASAPAALDTLNELAAALGNDAAFSTTVTNSLASKAPLANPTFTGTVTASKVSISSDASFSGRVDVCGNFYANYPDSSIPQSAIVGGISSAAIVDLTSNQTISGVKTFSTQLNIGTNTLTPLAILAVSQMGSNLVGRTVVVQAGASVALNDAGTIIAIGCPNDYMYGNYSGSVRVYQWSGSAWSQLGADIMGTRENNTLGYSVSLSSSGLILAIGGPNISTTRVYQYVSNEWTQLGADIVGTGGAGSSVSISADGMTVAIGAPQANASSGQTRVYKYISSTWTQLGQDIASEAAGDWSGVSVALSADGTTVVIGANYNMGAPGDMSGHARVYKYANSTWTQIGQDLDGEASYDMSGWSVAISDDGTIVAIGAPRNTTGATTYNGQVRVYQYANSTWTKLGQDIDGRAIWAQSGSTVSLSADGYTVAIGADSATGLGGEANRGYATLYKYDGTIWKQLGTYLEGQAAGDKFGTSVALSADGTTLAAGAPFANSSDGFVKVYKIQNASSKIIVSNGFDICGNLYAQYPASSIPLTAISANLATLSYVDSSLNSKASLAAPTFTGTVVSSGDLALNSKLRVSGDASFNGRVDICGNFYAQYPASSIPVSAIAASLATVTYVDSSLNLKAPKAAPTFTGTVVSSGDLSLNSKLRVSGDSSFNGRVDICGNFYAKYPASSIPASAIVGVSDTLSVTNINISGNVGIGTTTPLVPLQVVGNSKIGSLSLTTISAQTGLVYDSSWSQVGNTIQGRWWDLSGVLSASYAGWSTAINGDGTIMAHGSSTNYVNIFKYRTITLAEWNLVSTTNRTMPVAKHPDTVYDSTKKYWVQMGNSIIDGVGVDDHYDAVSLNEAGDTIVIGAAWDDKGGSNMGTCKVFKYDSATDAWNQVGQNIYGSVVNEYFGGVVDINAAGNIIAVGGQLFNSYSGRAVVYRYDSATNLWNQIGQTFTGGKVGASLSLSSDGYTVAIAHADTMIAKIYTYSSGTNLFVQNGGNIVSEVTNDRNASSVSLSADGTMVAVGASWANSQAGQARVYEYRFATAEEWAEVSTTLRSGVVVKNGDTTLNATKKYWVQIGNDVNGNGGRSGIGVSLRKHSVHGTTLAMMSTGSVRLFKYRQITQSEWNTSTLMKGNDTVYSSTKSYWIQLGYDKSISAAGGISTALDLNSDGTVLTFGSPTSTNYLNQVNGGLIYVFSTPYVATNFQNDSIIDTLDNNARRNLILNNTLSIDPSGVTTIAGRIDICGNLYAKYPDASIPASAINGVSSNVQTALNLKSDLTYVDASLNLKANLVSPTFTGPFVVASGDVSMNNNLRLGGDLIVKGNLSVFRQENNSIINTTINNYEIVITKDISLNGNLVIANNASLNSKLFVSDDVSLNNKLFVNGNATLNSKLSVANDASFNGRVDICGNLYAQYPNSSIPVSAITDGVTLSYVDASLNLKSDLTYVDASLNLKSDLTYVNNALNLKSDITYVDASLNLKSDITYVDASLNLKSNLTYVDNALNLKSDRTYVDSSLNLKSDLTYVDTALNLKSNLTYVDASLNLKSDITSVDASLNLKSDRTYVDTAMNLKSNLTYVDASLNLKSNITYVDASLNLKSDRTYVDTALNLKSNLTYVDASLNLKSDRTYVDTALNLKSNLTYVDTSLNLKANQTYVDTALNLKANLASPTFTGIPNAPTASYDNSSNQVATTGFVQGRISSIINSAPAALDTLNELAAALGNDSNYAATVTNSLSQKANITDVNSALALKSNLTYVDASLNLKSDITYVDTALNLKSNLTYVDASLNLKSNITYVDTALNLKSNLAYVDSSLNLKSNLTYVDSSLNVKPSFSQVDSSLNLKSNLAYVDASLNLKANATDVNSALALKSTIASVDASLNLKSNITYVDASLNLKSAVTYVDTSLNLKANLASPTFTGIPNAPTASYDNSSNQVATTGFVQGRISAIINSAPAALDTLNELAAALGNDANYAATITNSLSQKANITDVNSALALKASIASVDASLNLKANAIDVNSALALKASIASVDASLNLKSNLTYVDTSLNLKSNLTYVDASLNLKANTADVNSALALKAPIASVDASLNLKSNITYVDASLNLKANATDVNSALALKAPIASVDASLNLKSNITYVDASLNVKPSFSQVDASLNLKSAVTYVDASLNLKATLASPTFTGTPNAPTASYDNSSNQIATTGFVQGRISAIINSAPAALDTLNELAAALGNDSNYAATVTNSLSQKANITDVNSSLALKATITAVDASLNLKSNITYVDAALAAKPSFSQVDASLNLKSAITYVDASLNAKPSFSQVDASLNTKSAVTYVDASLNLKSNVAYVDASLNAKPSFSQVDASLNLKSAITYVDASLNAKPSFSQVDASLNLKSAVTYVDASLNLKATLASPTFTGTPNAPTAAYDNSSNQIATTGFVQGRISSIINSAPAALDTLNELAAALGNDANYAATVTNLLSQKANATDVNSTLVLKATITAVDASLNLKSNITYVDAALNAKPNFSQVDASLNLKSNITYVDTALNAKPSFSQVDASLNLKSNITYVDTALNAKPSFSQVDASLNLKSAVTYVDASLNLKSNITYVDAALNAKPSFSQVDASLNLRSAVTYVDASLNAKPSFSQVDASLNLRSAVTYVDASLNLKANLVSPTFTGTPNAPTAAYDNSSNQIATTGFVQGRISSIINSAPAALDTLNELAAALGNDANYAATVTNTLSQKANATDVTSALALKATIAAVDASLNLKSNITYVDAALTAKPSFSQVDASLNLKANITYVDASLNLKSDRTYVDAALTAKPSFSQVDASLNLKSNVTYVDAALTAKPSFSQVDVSLNAKPSFSQVDVSLNAKPSFSQVDVSLNAKPSFSQVDASLNLKSDRTYVDSSLNTKPSFSQVDASLNLKANATSPTFTGILTAAKLISGDASFNGNLDISGVLSVTQTVNSVVKNTTINNYNVSVTNDLSLNGKLVVSSDVSMNSKLYVKGDASFGRVDICGNFYAQYPNNSIPSSAISNGVTLSYVDASLNLKSAVTYVDASLNLKSSVTYVDAALNLKPSFSQVDSSLNLKSNLTYVDAALTAKPSFSQVDASLNLKSNITYVDAALTAKPSFSQVDASLNLKSNITYVDASLNLKSNITYVDAALNAKPNFSQVDASLNLKSNLTYVDSSLNLKANLVSPTFTGIPNAPTASYDNSSNQIATTGFVQGRISSIINSAPAALDTLNELAAALGNDANYAATVTNTLSQKANITDVNTALALKPSFSQVDASLNLKPSFSQIDASLNAKPSFSQVDASLNLKPSFAQVDASLNLKSAVTYVDASLNLKSAVTYVDASLNLKPSFSQVDASLNAKPSFSQIDASLNLKPSFSQVDASLNLKSNLTYVDASLSLKPSFSQVDASLNLKPSFSQIDASLNLKSAVTYVDASLNLKSAVTYVDASLNLKANLASPTFTGTPNAPTAAYDNSSNQIATTGFVQGRISAIINSAPAALDTLNELAAALGNDANYAATVTNSLSQKANITDVNNSLALKPSFSQVDASLNLKPTFAQVDASLNLKPTFAQVDASLNSIINSSQIDASLNLKPSFSQVDASLNLKSNVAYVDASLNLKSAVTYVDASLNLKSAVTYVDASLNLKPSFSQVDSSLNLKSAVTYVDASLNLKANLASPTFTGTPNAPTAAYDNSSNQIATTGFVQGRISAIINSAPAALDTLNELAAALGNDANYASTVTNLLSQKANATDVNSALALKPSFSQVDASLNLKPSFSQIDASLNLKPIFSQVDASLNLKAAVTYVDLSLSLKPSFSQVDASLNLKAAVTYVDSSLSLKPSFSQVDTSLNLKAAVTYVDSSLSLKPSFSQVDASLNLKPTFAQVDASLNAILNFSQVDASLNLKPSFSQVDASLNLKSAVTYVDASLNLKSAVTYVDASLNLKSAVTYVDSSLNLKANLASPTFTGIPNAPTAAYDNSSNQIATTGFVQGRISSIINSAPAALDTLNELAAALGNDANYAATVTNTLSQKANTTDVNAALALKPTFAQVDASLNLKPTSAQVDASLNLKPTFAQVDASLNLKPTFAQVDASLNAILNFSQVDASLNLKPSFVQVDASLNLKSNLTYVDASLNLKPRFAQVDASLNLKPSFVQVDASLNLKPSFAQVDVSLNLKPSFSQVDSSLNLKPSFSQADASLNLKANVASPTFTGVVTAPKLTSGDASFNGNIDISGVLSVTQTVNSVVKNTTINNYNVAVTNDLSLNGKLIVSSDVSLNSKLFVKGDASFNGRVDICGNFYANYPANSIPSSAIIGGVSSGSTSGVDISSNQTISGVKTFANGLNVGNTLVSSVAAALAFDPSFQRIKIGQDIDGETADDQSGFAVSLSSDGTIIAIGARFNDGTASNAGQVRVYKNISGTWTKLGQDIDGEATPDQSGYSVSLSADGTIVAIGAIYNDGGGADSGHVRVYQYNGSTTWTQLGQDINGEATTDWSGYSVSLSSDGTIVAIGSWYNNGVNGSDSGHVRIYKYDGSTTWTKLGQDIDGEAANDQSGFSVSLSSNGQIVAIGARYNAGTVAASYRGQVRVYQYNGTTTWTQIGQDIDGEASQDNSGWSVSLSSDGTIVAIGAVNNDGTTGTSTDNRGSIRVYKNISGTWTQLGQDIDGEAAGDNSGFSISLNGDGTIIAIGAYLNDGTGSNSGHVRIYQFISNTWQQLGSDVDGEAAGDQSGYSVSLSRDGTMLAVGANQNDGANGVDSGHVRVYQIRSAIASSTKLTIGNNVDICGNFYAQYAAASIPASAINGISSAIQTAIDLKATKTIVDASFTSVNSAIALKANLASPALTGVPTAPTASAGTNTTQLATTEFTTTAVSTKANLASPALTGVPTAPTASAGTNTTQLATTAFVKSAVDNLVASAPAALDTLNELAAALGSDASFSTTVTNSLASKAPLANPTFTGTINASKVSISSDASFNGRVDICGNFYAKYPASSIPASAIIGGVGGGGSFDPNTDLSLNQKLAVGGDVSLNSNVDIRGNVIVGAYSYTSPVIDASSQWVQLGSAINGQFAGDMFGSWDGLDMNADGTIIVLGGHQYSSNTGRAVVYKYINSAWTQLGQTIVGSGTNVYCGVFTSINAAGDIIAVSSTYTDVSYTDSGSVTIYKYNTSSSLWVQLGQTLNGPAVNAHFGFDIELNADGYTIVIGNGDLNQCFVYRYNGTSTWNQLGNTITGATGDVLGLSVTINDAGNIVALGTLPTTIKVFSLVGSTWTILGATIVTGATSGRYDKLALSSDGYTLIAGEPNNQQHAIIYRYNGSAWSQLGQTITETGVVYFGGDVAINFDGTVVAIGAAYTTASAGSNAGRVFSYKYNGTSWVRIGQSIDGIAAGNLCGLTVSLSRDGTILAAGSPNYGGNLGQVRVYSIPHTGGYAASGSLNVINSASINSTLTVVGNTTLSTVTASKLTLTSDASFSGRVDICGNFYAKYPASSIPASAIIGGVGGGSAFATDICVNSITVGRGPGDSTFSTVLGLNALGRNTGGYMNVAVGCNSLFSNLTGNQNVAMNFSALYANTSGSDNIAIGKQAITANQTGSNNVGIGSLAIQGITSSNNTAVGYRSLVYSSTGSSNTAFGYLAGGNNSTGSFNTYIGYGADVPAFGATWSNSTAIGANAMITASNQITLGTAAERVFMPGKLTTSGDASFNGRVDISGNATASKMRVTSDASFNGRVDICGNLYANYPANSIPQSAIIGGVGGGSSVVDLTTSQTITGTKTFSNQINIGSNAITQLATLAVAQLGTNLLGRLPSLSGSATALNDAGTIVAVGSPGDSNYRGAVRMYQWSGTAWTQLGQDILSTTDGTQMGCAVSLSSTGLFLAAGGLNRVRIYQYSNSTWSQLGADIIDAAGSSISISSDGMTFASGNPGAYINGGENTGRTRIYKYINSTWTQLGQDLLGEAASNRSGFSLALSADGTIVVIGAHYNDGTNSNGTIRYMSGHARIYKYANSTWTQLGQDIDGEVSYDMSGWSVDISQDGTIVAIGAPRNTTGATTYNGQARIYKYANSTWTQVGQDIDGRAIWAQSGSTVSLSADGYTVAIGSSFATGLGGETDRGYAVVYKYNGTTWSMVGSYIEGQAAGDQFGFSLALSADGTILSVGSPYNNSNAGNVKVYKIQTASSKIIVSDGVDICGNLYAKQLQLSSNATFNGRVDISGNLYANSLQLTNSATFNGRVDICGNFYAQYPPNSIPASAIIGGVGSSSGSSGSSTGANVTFTDSFALIKEAVVVDPASILLRQF